MVSCPPVPWVGGDGEGGFPVSHFQQPSCCHLRRGYVSCNCEVPRAPNAISAPGRAGPALGIGRVHRQQHVCDLRERACLHTSYHVCKTVHLTPQALLYGRCFLGRARAKGRRRSFVTVHVNLIGGGVREFLINRV